ncbi:serine/threonine protein kinase [Tahibacter aquaticus]|uniref:Serine/threonine protein kinase n=1 Tax=Tahibacter aquaticus TaxID=520092 RepID=A0A4V3DLF9_9GAMM|nr:protein kinase [Tahibacter aquaticus]TDR39414.1 serine/threonine protein kinase [Tahibacter aquaticus]
MRTEKILLVLGSMLLLALIALAGWRVLHSADTDARRLGAERLQSAALAHAALQDARARELRLITRQLSTDQGFVSYIAQSLRGGSGGAVDSASIRDLLDERRGQLDMDVALLLDNQGRTIVDTSAYQSTRSDLSHNLAVAQVIQSLQPASGYLSSRSQLLQIAVEPLLLGGSSEGVLVSGKFVDDAGARRIGQIAGTDLALLARTADGFKVVASTLEPDMRKQLLAAATAHGWTEGRQESRGELLALGPNRWLVRLQASAEDGSNSLLITLLEQTAVAAPYAAVRTDLLVGGAVLACAVVLLAALAWWRLLAPLGQLSRSAASIGTGALEPVPVAGSGGSAALGQALGRLVGELREQRDFEAYSADLLRQRTRSSETGPRGDAAAAIDHGAAARLQAGTVLADRYEIYARVGAGQSGVVYRALDRRQGEVVAFKLLGPTAIADTGHAAHIKKLLRAGAALNHPGVARIGDVGQIDEGIYVAGEYVRGITLKQALARTGRIPLYAALHVARDICAGLAGIHAAGTAHGALRPSNIVLSPGMAAQLLDLGLTPPPPGFDAARPELQLRSDPTYLSPQQIVGKLADHHDDVYTLGLILTEVFTSRLPQSGSPAELCRARVQREATPPSRLWTEIPPPIEALLLGCLERDPAKRFADAVAVQRELDRCRL